MNQKSSLREKPQSVPRVLTPDTESQQGRAEFPVTIENDTWYSVVVEDAAGNKAYSNPIWFDAVTYEATASVE